VYNPSGKLPKIPFPKFAGEHPKLWQSRSERYFDMYGVDRSVWVSVACMYFDDAAARWLQSVESKISSMEWDVFCDLIHDRFSRDQQESLIRQLFHIKQTSTVAEYVQRFTELVDQLSAYTSSTDPRYYLLRFIDGLHDDIRSVVLVQRPNDLDTACVLAELQEEVGDRSRHRDFGRPNPAFAHRPAPQSPLSVPPPPPSTPVVPDLAADHRGIDSARA